eukprot:7856018-Pyramimonas_sp.AAC.2
MGGGAPVWSTMVACIITVLLGLVLACGVLHHPLLEEGDSGRRGLQGPRPRAGELGGPASEQPYEVGWANALHLRPPPSYPRSYIIHINAVPTRPSQHDLP